MHAQREPTAQPSAGERGFGVIEIVISMFLLALLAVAFLPLLVQTLRVSATNTTTATATQLVNDQMERARAAGSTCEALQGFQLGTVDPVTDPRGVVLQGARAVGACPAAGAYPGTVSVTITVKKASSAVPVAQATSLIYVKSERSG